VKQRLEVRERRIGAPNQIEEPGELRLFEHREPLHDDRVAGQREPERLGHLRGGAALVDQCNGEQKYERNATPHGQLPLRIPLIRSRARADEGREYSVVALERRPCKADTNRQAM
jgi:hypothetical protein